MNNQDSGDASFAAQGLCAANQSAPQGRSFVAQCLWSTLRNNLNALPCRTGFHVLPDFAQKRLRCQGEKKEEQTTTHHPVIARNEAISKLYRDLNKSDVLT